MFSAIYLAMSDALNDVLRLIRLTGCVYFARQFGAPWGMEMADGPYAQFHAVLRGSCVVEYQGQIYYGTAGDVFLFPKGAGHTIGDEVGRPAVAGMDFMASFETKTPMFTEGRRQTRLMCGHYEYNRQLDHPMITDLPDVIHLTPNDMSAPKELVGILSALLLEVSDVRPGADAVIEKLAEVLLIQVLRAHFSHQNPSNGILAGLCDAKLSRALSLMHKSPDQDLNLHRLASEAGMSRSAFAERFRSVTSLTPMAYLTHWRMCVAHDLLQHADRPIAKVAAEVGYESDVAFSRAFKSHFGLSPSQAKGFRSSETK